jgi:predicted PurR-regulated permease PerM
MLGIDRKAARYVWTALVVILLLCLVYLVRKTLFVFVLAVLLAYLLSPMVQLFDRFLPGQRTRAPALAMAYIIFLGLIGLIGSQIGARVVEQGHELQKHFPDMLNPVAQPSPTQPEAVNSIKAQVIERLRAAIVENSSDIFSAASKAGLQVLTLASDLIYLVIIPILAFFFLKDGHAIRQHLLEIVEEGPRREMIDDLLADTHLLLAHYMRALVLLSFAAFTVYAIFFAITGMPYGFLLAALAAMLEFIPMVGPLTAGVSILIVAAVSHSHLLAVLIFLLAYRLFQDYILSPHLMGQGVELHPLLILFGVFAGAELAGVAGTFLSVPVLALIRIVYLRMRRSRLRPEFEQRPTLRV